MVAEVSELWPSDAKSWLIEKDPDLGKDWVHKRVIDYEMVGWQRMLKKQRHYFAYKGPFSQSYGFLGFHGGSDGKASACNAGDPGSIPGSGRSPEEGNGNPLQYSCLKNYMVRGAWWATVHGVTKSQTWLSDFTLMFFPVVMCGCENHKEGWTLKNWCFWTVVLEKTLESLLDCKDIKSANPKGSQS